MGLPQLDFRVPEATWLKSALVSKLAGKLGLAGRFGGMPGLSSTGALAWPYKIAVVAVMALVACGTLVTFGSAGAETPSSAQVAALPGTDEASPSVEGQVVPPSQALLNGADLMSTLNLSDFSPADADTIDFSLSDSDDSDNSDDDSDDQSDTKKKTTATKTGTDTNAGSGGSGGSTDESDAEEVEGPKHKAWVQANAAYEDAMDDYEDAKAELEDWEDENDTYQDCRKNPLKYWGKNCDKDLNPGPKPSVPSEPQSPGPEPDFTD